MKGVKYDSGKPRWSLLPLDAIEWVVKVLTIAAKEKYEDDNWKKVDNSIIRYQDALWRHIAAHKKGEWLDKEDKMPHLAHALCCLIFWFWHELKKRKLVNK